MSRERLQQIAAIFLLVLATIPVPFLLSALLQKFPPASQPLIDLLGAPGAPALWASYVSVIFSTLLGANLLDALKTKHDGKDSVTRWGVAVLAYTGVMAMFGLAFLALVSDPTNANEFATLTNENERLQIHSYTTWIVGTCLTIVASLLGVPAPKKADQ